MTDSRRKSSGGKVAKPSSSPVTLPANVTKALSVMPEDILFLPNPAQRRVKARFWAHYEPVAGLAALDAAMVGQVTNEPSIVKWWGLPGFREWFKNEDESRERLEYLFQLSLDSAEELLLNPDTHPSAKVQLIKAIGLLAGKEPAKQPAETRFLDVDIAKMDSEKLREYVRRQSERLAT